ncbi:hypothetical protein [Maricaulis sp.]|jgi:hypothetical protein|uniref:hypothetical protein n=1 Tax=Maricaulis sp. TaxID=1486257 RepID=UPI00260B1750|nr:hypothetical protein [Maricaulis sp.]
MKKHTMMIAASLAGALALVGQSTAQTPRGSDAFVLEMLGQRGWEVSCRLTQDDGDVIESRERGRGLHDNGRFAIGDVTGGLCSYNVPDQGELRLTMTVEHTGFNCPFAITEAGFCRAYLRPGQSGSFQITRTSPAVTGS